MRAKTMAENLDGGGCSPDRTSLPTPNSLLTGKLTGNFADSDSLQRFGVQLTSEFNDFQRNSLRNGTGNFWRPNKEFFGELTGNLIEGS